LRRNPGIRKTAVRRIALTREAAPRVRRQIVIDSGRGNPSPSGKLVDSIDEVQTSKGLLDQKDEEDR